MSNLNVGQIYQRVIQDVIETSQVDFEEAGVDQRALEDLKELWQQKLTKMNVAQFPWDPAPPVPSAPQTLNPTPVPQIPQPQPPPQPQSLSSAPPPTKPSPSATDGVAIKTEPGYEPAPSFPSLPQSNGVQSQGPTLNSQAAQQRAAGLLQAQFGNQASRQVDALQNGLVMPGQPGSRPQGLQLPGQTQMTMPQQYQRPQQQARPQQANSVGNSQTDGAGDSEDSWPAVILRRNACGDDEAMGRVEIDEMIRRHVEETGHRMEGGGLMVPLEEVKKSKKRRIPGGPNPNGIAPSSSLSAPPSNVGISQFDGIADEDGNVDEDEDAINSDLDDPEENLDDDEEADESVGQIMLCTYDKVQRVKNKWKCTLKDGVLTTNGKEYVFHKAQGEFEW